MGRVKLAALVVLVSSAALCLPTASAQLLQQGPKLVGTGAVGGAFEGANQGRSVALSADGNTAVEGGSNDSSGVGAAWFWSRSGEVWTQQGAKQVGTGAAGIARQGVSVALSADGNTALVGGAFDDSNKGAAWVYTRSGGVWTQQGAKLVGNGAVGNAFQGFSVALSADGDTAMIGGALDDSNKGAVWVFTRSGGAWTPQGGKLVGTGAVGNAEQGGSVALSADGNTAVVGGALDSANTGAAWIFTRSGGVWTQQGAKLVGTGAVGNALQGFSVALSGDGDTAMVGGPTDNPYAGAAWIFTRSGGVWTQQGANLVGTGAAGDAQQGSSVALSADGNTAAIGGLTDNSSAGAVWVHTRTGGIWTQQGAKLVGAGAVGNAQQGISVALSSNGDTVAVGGPADDTGAGAMWIFAKPMKLPTLGVPVPSLRSSALLALVALLAGLALLRLGRRP